MMKNYIKNVILTIASLAIICAVFWIIGWISSWKEVAGLYGIMVIVISISTLTRYLKTKIKNNKDKEH